MERNDRDDEARRLLESATTGMEADVAKGNAQDLARIHGSYYKTLITEFDMRPDDAIHFLHHYVEFLFQSGMVAAINEANSNAAKLIRGDGPDGD
jgi:hypothetical protein